MGRDWQWCTATTTARGSWTGVDTGEGADVVGQEPLLLGVRVHEAVQAAGASEEAHQDTYVGEAVCVLDDRMQ